MIAGPPGRWWRGLAAVVAANAFACADGGPAAPTVVRDPIEAPFVSMATGAGYSCGLTGRGSVYCWGSGAVVSPATGTRDRCGKDTDSFHCLKTPARLDGLPPLVTLQGDSGHACGLTASGEAWCWGFGSSGTLGSGVSSSLPHAPARVVGGLAWRAISVGSENTCGLASDNAAYCWGARRAGAIGDGRAGDDGIDAPVPVRVASAVPMTTIIAGSFFACGLAEGGAALCWGDMHSIPLRGSCTFGRCNRVPEPIPGSLRFRALADGDRHACGLTDDGGAYCWGTNSAGELGNGVSETAVNPEVPRRVRFAEPFAFLAAGREMTCGVTAAGDAYCWGGNYSGRFGNGTMTPSPLPVAALSGLRVKSISIGQDHACAVALDGRAYCWGRNESGAVGDGTEVSTERPVLVTGQS